MECFIVYNNNIEGRIDPFYYKPEFRQLVYKLSKINHKELSEVIEFSKDVWDQKSTFNTEFPYIEINNINLDTGKITGISYYEKSKAPSRARMIVKENDIIISTTRPNRGAISLINKEFDGFIASTGFTVLRKLKMEGVKREYLFYFLRTQLSLKQMLQRSSGGNYPAITAEELKHVLVPIPSIESQNKIIALMQKAYQIMEQINSKVQQIIDSIGTYILGELGIKMPQLIGKTHNIVYSINSNYLVSNRWDPYYYQPNFKGVEKAIENGKYETKKIGEILTVNDKFEDISKYNQIKYIDLASIRKDIGLVESIKTFYPTEAPSRARQKLEYGDLLLSSLNGSLTSIAVFDKKENNYIASTGFFIIKKSDEYNNIYLWALFRSSPYQLLLSREASGAIMSSINRDSLSNIRIPLPIIEIQNKIAEEVKNRIQQVEKLQKEAKEVLENAKKDVEMLILDG